MTHTTSARCGSWHYAHATGTTAKFAGCKQFVPKSVEGCPNCEHFYKKFGVNYCAIADWSLPPEHISWDAMRWLQENQDDSSRIGDDADNCPRFEPHCAALKNWWHRRDRTPGASEDEY